MKRIALKLMYRIMPTNILIRITNNPSFSEIEERVIGEELNRRFKTDEEIEEACIKVLG